MEKKELRRALLIFTLLCATPLLCYSVFKFLSFKLRLVVITHPLQLFPFDKILRPLQGGDGKVESSKIIHPQNKKREGL